MLERLSWGCTLFRIHVEICVELHVVIMLDFLKGNWMSSSGSIGVTQLNVSVTGNVFSLLDQVCSGSLLGSIHLQGCLSIHIEVWKCLHVGIFHLQSLEVLVNSSWLIFCSLVCECTECKVPVQKGDPNDGS